MPRPKLMARKNSVVKASDESKTETPQNQDEEFKDDKSFSELRYNQHRLTFQPSSSYIPKVVKVSVVKTRKFWHLSDIRSNSVNDFSSIDPASSSKLGSMSSRGGFRGSSGEKDKHNNNSMTTAPYLFLNESAIEPERLTACTNATQELLTPRSSFYIRRPRRESETFRAQLLASLKKESHCLSHHAKVKQEQLRQENDMMTKSGKNRENLLQRRHQLMPHVSSDSQERSAVAVERSVTPTKFPDWVLWAPVIYDFKEKNGIRPQMTKRQRGYDVVTDWVGHPEITDEVRKELGLNVEHVMSDLVPNGRQEQVCAQQMDCRCLPTFPRLGVLGFNYNEIQHHLRQPIRRMIVLGNDQQTRSGENSFASLSLDCDMKPDEATVPSMASLMLGHVHLYWSTNPQRKNKTFVVELGCSADLYNHSIDYVLMRNTGTTVIRFSWIKKHARETFQKHNADQMRMVFDSVEGVILPGEQYRIPFMYKALTSGQFSEDWKLLTQPVMENGAEIILRLWGFTRLPDEQLSTRERIDDILKRKMGFSIARQIVHKLVNTLPLEEPTFYDALIKQSELKGPDLFLYNNPWLYYNSYHVDRLGKLAKFIESESKKQQKPNVSICDTDPSNEGIATRLDPTTPEPKQGEASMSLPGSDLQIQQDLNEDDSSVSSSDLGSVSGEIMNLRNELFAVCKPLEVEANPPEKPAVVKKKKDNDRETEGESVTEMNQSQDNVSKVMTLSDESMRFTDVGQAKSHDSVVNTIDPNIVVHSIRNDLILCKANYIRQDALFELVSEEVSSLLFRPFYPYANWKMPVVKGLFSKAMEDFECYACMLQNTCYEAQHFVTANETEANLKFGASASVSSAGSTQPSVRSEKLSATVVTTSIQTGDVEAESFSTVLQSIPRVDLEPERYKHQYYGRLYTRMFWLLSDICDRMDILVYERIQIDKSYGKEQFIKVDKVPLNVDMKHELVRPLPPKWVNILHKMNNIRRQFYNESISMLNQVENFPLSE